MPQSRASFFNLAPYCCCYYCHHVLGKMALKSAHKYNVSKPKYNTQAQHTSAKYISRLFVGLFFPYVSRDEVGQRDTLRDL